MTRVEFAKGTSIDLRVLRFEEAVVDSILPPADDSGTIGTDLRRWSYIRGVVLASGHFKFENDFMISENPERLGGGIVFINEKGNSVAVLDSGGNLRIEGVFAHRVPVEEVKEKWSLNSLRKKLKKKLSGRP